MNDEELAEKRYSLEELSSATGFSRRTIRFYMQLGLVPKPEGANRGAYYTTRHVERLLEVRRMQNDGVSLKRIGQELGDFSSPREEALLSVRSDVEIAVKSHISLAPGVELVVDSETSGIGNRQARELAQKISAMISEIRELRRS